MALSPGVVFYCCHDNARGSATRAGQGPKTPGLVVLPQVGGLNNKDSNVQHVARIWPRGGWVFEFPRTTVASLLEIIVLLKNENH